MIEAQASKIKITDITAKTFKGNERLYLIALNIFDSFFGVFVF